MSSALISCCTSVSYYYTIWSLTGHLPSPENVLINESVNSSSIKWKLPYSSMNSVTIHVDPHITQYTVYITDSYTGNITVKQNLTETQYTSNTQDDDLCPIYQISVWNGGGEGELSEPVQESSLRGKQVTEEPSELIWLCRPPCLCNSLNCYSPFCYLSQFLTV